MGYDILINAPKQVPLTRKEFKDLSVYEFASVFINYPVVFHYTDKKDLKLYTSKEYFCNCCSKNWRFKKIQWYNIGSLETYTCVISKRNKMFAFITDKLDHLIMK